MDGGGGAWLKAGPGGTCNATLADGGGGGGGALMLSHTKAWSSIPWSGLWARKLTKSEWSGDIKLEMHCLRTHVTGKWLNLQSNLPFVLLSRVQ